MKLAGPSSLPVLFGWVVLCSTLLLCASPAWTRDTDPLRRPDTPEDKLEEIVVTARKREESLQEAPISITTFPAAWLRQQSIREFNQLSMSTPGVRIESVPGAGNTSQVTIRGISQPDFLVTSDPSVGIYLDGIYSPRLQAANLALLDVERIEVLRGPQGTLYGKNTPAGAIRILSTRPDGKLGGWARVGYGSDQRIEASTALGFPLLGAEGETLAGRIALLSSHRDGRVDSRTTLLPDGTLRRGGGDLGDDQSRALKLALRWQPSDSIELLARGYRMRERNRSGNPAILTAYEPRTVTSQVVDASLIDTEFLQEIAARGDTDDVFLSLSPKDDSDALGGSLEASWNLPLGTLSYLGGLRSLALSRRADLDGSPIEIASSDERIKSRQSSHELQLTGDLTKGRIAYTVGLFHFAERASDENQSAFSTAFAGIGAQNVGHLVSKIRSYAAYGQVNVALTNRLSVTGGIRSTYERRSISRRVELCSRFLGPDCLPLVDTDTDSLDSNGILVLRAGGGHRRFDAVSWLAGVEYRPSSDMLLYAKASRGYRTGGFNGRATSASQLRPFQEEFNTSYEIGLKSEWFDQRARANLSAYYSKYKDQQSVSIEQVETGIATIVRNGGSADISGGELELLLRPIPTLQLGATVAVNYFRATSGILSGGIQSLSNGLPGPTQTSDPLNAPILMYTLSADWQVGEYRLGRLGLRLDWLYQSTNEGSPNNGFSVARKIDPRLPGCGQFAPAEQNCEIVPSTSDNVAQGAYGILNARLTFELSDWNADISLFARNLLDRKYFSGGIDLGAEAGLGVVVRSPGPRRFVGLEVTYRFGGQ